MTPAEVLQKVHVRYEKNTDYPTAGSEDHTVRLAFLDDSISVWEKEVKEGVVWDSLKASASIVTDDLPADFYDFLRAEGQPAYIKQGSAEYSEVTLEDGNKFLQAGKTPYVFWAENGKLKSLPTMSGTIEFPYIRKATRFPLGTENTQLDMENPTFSQEYILAQLYLDDGNINQYNAHVNTAEDILDTMRISAIKKVPTDNFPIGA